MNKKQEMMNKAVHLFSVKGFHKTSVQEIAQAVDISKGAFYKHYDSKESLLVGILRRYKEDTITGASNLDISSVLNKKEVFAKKLAFELERILADRDFFIMVFKDMPTDSNEQLTQLMHELRSASIELHKNSLLETFGPETKPFIQDLVTVLEGILKEYVISTILENRHLPIDKLSLFITSVMDSIVLHLASMEPVFLKEEETKEVSLEKLISDIENKIKLYSKNTADLLASLHLLHEELQQPKPREFLIEALSNYLKQVKQIETEVLLLKNHI